MLSDATQEYEPSKIADAIVRMPAVRSAYESA
jgi:hypothetical protein